MPRSKALKVIPIIIGAALHGAVHLHGRIADEFGNPIAQALVTVATSQGKRQAMTDGHGCYGLTIFSAGPVKIWVSKDHYRHNERSLVLGQDATYQIDTVIRLESWATYEDPFRIIRSDPVPQRFVWRLSPDDQLTLE